MNPYLSTAWTIAERRCGAYSCVMIDEAVNWPDSGSHSPETKAYIKMFRPRNPPSKTFWLDGIYGDSWADDAAKEWRLTALCFAAAMYDTGDL